MFVYIGKSYTSITAGRKRKRVICEQCRATYHYDMVRVGVGRGHSAYMLDNSGAAGRASGRADDDLAGKLLDDVEPVPCPKCGWFQPAMVKLMRQEYHRSLFTSGLTITILSLAALILIPSARTSPMPAWFLVLGGLGLLAGSAMVAYRIYLLGKYDPNARYPHMPEIPPGSPPALIAATDAAGRAILTPAAPATPQVTDGWIAHRLLADEFAPYCCRCLSPADRTFKPPLQTHSNIPVPLCRKCAGMNLALWWMWTLITVALVAGASWYIAQIPRGIDLVGQILMATMIWIFASVAAVAIFPTLLSKPFKVRILSNRRHVYWLKFPNPQYALLLAKSVVENQTAKPQATTARIRR